MGAKQNHNEPDVLSNQNKIWDPAEIVEFYSTISAGSRHSNFIKCHLVIVPGQVGVSSRRRLSSECVIILKRESSFIVRVLIL